jgi:hypothetical protein
MTPYPLFQKKPVLPTGADAVEALFIHVRAFIAAVSKART